MRRGLAIAVLVCAAACARGEPAIGERVVVVASPAEWDPARDCGALFPRLLDRREGAFAPYVVACPAMPTGREHVERVRRVQPVEPVLRAGAVLVRGLVWLVIALAVLGVVWRDPFGWQRRLRELEAATAAARRARDAAAAERGGDLPVLAPLSCPGCGAAVPLDSAETVACPHCSGRVEVPPSYWEPARLRRQTHDALRRAAVLWRWHERLGRRGLAIARWGGLALVGASSAYGAFVGALRGVTLLFAVAFFLGAALAPVIVATRPRRRQESARLAEAVRAVSLPASALAGRGACPSCAAPLFAMGAAELVVGCTYCGAESLLSRRAARVHAVAAARAERATGDLLEATALLVRRGLAAWRAASGAALGVVAAVLAWILTLPW